jgi:hypothetical protein
VSLVFDMLGFRLRAAGKVLTWDNGEVVEIDVRTEHRRAQAVGIRTPSRVYSSTFCHFCALVGLLVDPPPRRNSTFQHDRFSEKRL